MPWDTNCSLELAISHMYKRDSCIALISCRYIRNARLGKVENFMVGKMTPFCAAGNKYLGMGSRVPGKEMDKLVSYKEENPTHSIVIR